MLHVHVPIYMGIYTTPNKKEGSSSVPTFCLDRTVVSLELNSQITLLQEHNIVLELGRNLQSNNSGESYGGKAKGRGIDEQRR